MVHALEGEEAYTKIFTAENVVFVCGFLADVTLFRPYLRRINVLEALDGCKMTAMTVRIFLHKGDLSRIGVGAFWGARKFRKKASAASGTLDLRTYRPHRRSNTPKGPPLGPSNITSIYTSEHLVRGTGRYLSSSTKRCSIIVVPLTNNNFSPQLLKIFNRYAFCFVAIYGHDFKTAGRAVFDLFRRMGWTTIINDDLIEMTLNIGSLGVAGLTALAGYLYSQAMNMTSEWATILAIVGGLFGFVMSGVCLSVVSSAVATIFVCFADAPQAFFQTHPDHAEALTSAWSQFHGESFDTCNYNQYRVH